MRTSCKFDLADVYRAKVIKLGRLNYMDAYYPIRAVASFMEVKDILQRICQTAKL